MADELIQSYREHLEYGANDTELLGAIQQAMSESKDLKDEMDKVAKRNKLFWRYGSEINDTNLHPKKSRVVVNRIFTDVETSIPILTAEPPEPTILGEVDNKQREELAKGLEIAYEVKYAMQTKLQHLVRQWYISRIGVWKYRWDDEDGFCTEVIIPKKVGFDKTAQNIHESEYVWHLLEDSVENLVAKFSKKKEDILRMAGVAGNNKKTKLRYVEFWGGNGEWVCWKMENIVLEKKKNPNWDYDDDTNNIFKKPKFPFILLSVFNFGDETGVYDETSIIEEAIPIQEAVNKLERQIADLNEGQKRVWIGAGISEKQFQGLIGATGDVGMHLDQRANVPESMVRQVQSGKPDASLYNHLTHLLGEIDNIFGSHSTTRGERKEQETLGGRQLLQAADIGRMDLIVRNVEQVMEEWYTAYLHMLKIYADEAEVLDNGEGERVELQPAAIPKCLVMVKKGTTLPTDKKTKQENAIGLAKFGMIDPATMFEELGYSNVDERVNDLYKWLAATGKLDPAVLQQLEQATPQGQAKQQASQQLQRLTNMLSSDQFQQLAPEEQASVVQGAKQVISTIKGQ